MIIRVALLLLLCCVVCVSFLFEFYNVKLPIVLELGIGILWIRVSKIEVTLC